MEGGVFEDLEQRGGEHAVQQFNGREGETATLLSRLSVKLKRAWWRFAPRHLKRSAFLGEIKRLAL